jgi:hypothetical protein
MRFARLLATAALVALPTAVVAQNRDSDDYRDGYRRGYDDGFAAGYRKALEEGARAPVPVAPVAPPPTPHRPAGPINITRAVYGGSSRSCDATDFARRQAQGRMSASFDVSNAMCGDPAPGDRKELEVTYVCGRGGAAKTASAREHRSVYLDCTN